MRLLPLSHQVLFAGVELAQVCVKHRVCSSAGLLDSTQDNCKGAQKSKADHFKRLNLKAIRRLNHLFFSFSDKSSAKASLRSGVDTEHNHLRVREVAEVTCSRFHCKISCLAQLKAVFFLQL